MDDADTSAEGASIRAREHGGATASARSRRVAARASEGLAARRQPRAASSSPTAFRAQTATSEPPRGDACEADASGDEGSAGGTEPRNAHPPHHTPKGAHAPPPHDGGIRDQLPDAPARARARATATTRPADGDAEEDTGSVLHNKVTDLLKLLKPFEAPEDNHRDLGATLEQFRRMWLTIKVRHELGMAKVARHAFAQAFTANGIGRKIKAAFDAADTEAEALTRTAHRSDKGFWPWRFLEMAVGALHESITNTSEVFVLFAAVWTQTIPPLAAPRVQAAARHLWENVLPPRDGETTPEFIERRADDYESFLFASLDAQDASCTLHASIRSVLGHRDSAQLACFDLAYDRCAKEVGGDPAVPTLQLWRATAQKLRDDAAPPATAFERAPASAGGGRAVAAAATATGAPTPDPDIICYTCGGRGHIARQCPSPPRERSAQDPPGKGGLGAGKARRPYCTTLGECVRVAHFKIEVATAAAPDWPWSERRVPRAIGFVSPTSADAPRMRALYDPGADISLVDAGTAEQLLALGLATRIELKEPIQVCAFDGDEPVAAYGFAIRCENLRLARYASGPWTTVPGASTFAIVPQPFVGFEFLLGTDVLGAAHAVLSLTPAGAAISFAATAANADPPKTPPAAMPQAVQAPPNRRVRRAAARRVATATAPATTAPVSAAPTPPTGAQAQADANRTRPGRRARQSAARRAAREAAAAKALRAFLEGEENTTFRVFSLTYAEPAKKKTSRNKPRRVVGRVELKVPTAEEALDPVQRGEACAVRAFDRICAEFPELFANRKFPPQANWHGENDIRVDPNATPYRAAPYRMPRERAVILQTLLDRLVSANILVEVFNPTWAAPVFIVPKPNSTKPPSDPDAWRVVADWKHLNDATILTAPGEAHARDITEWLSGKVIVSCFDMTGAYFQIANSKRAQELSVIVAPPCKYYAWQRAGMGLVGSLGTLNRFVADTLGPAFNEGWANAYSDNVYFASERDEDHEEHVYRGLRMLAVAGVLLGRSSCQLGVRRVNVLGLAAQLSPDPAAHPGYTTVQFTKVKALIEMSLPRTRQELISQLASLAFYRNYVYMFAERIAPAQALISTRSTPFALTKEAEAAIMDIRHAVAQEPCLLQPQMGRRFRLITDASTHAWGAVLEQEMSDTDPSWHPVMFLGGRWTKAELNYSAYEAENAALVHAAEAAEHYLLGGDGNIVLTDQKPLAHLLAGNRPPQNRSKERKAANDRARLQSFRFEFQYVPGRLNKADALSRYVSGTSDRSAAEIADKLLARQIPSVMCAEAVPPHPFNSATIQALREPAAAAYLDWVDETQRPPSSAWVASVHASRETLHPDRTFSKEQTEVLLIAHHNHESAKSTALRAQTLAQQSGLLARWPTVMADAHDFVRGCPTCQRCNPHGANAAPIPQFLDPTRFFEVVATDFIGPERRGGTGFCADSSVVVLTVMDLYTGYIWTYPAANPTSATAIGGLQHVFAAHGQPERLLSDRGSHFTSAEFQLFLANNNIKHNTSAAGRAQANGRLERQHGPLKEALHRIMEHEGISLEEALPRATFAANTRQSTVHGETPYYLAHGFDHPAGIGRHPPRGVDPRDVQARRARAAECRAMEAALRAADASVPRRAGDLAPDDLVLYKTRKARKADPPWWGPFKVFDVLSDSNVTLVDARGRFKVTNIAQTKTYAIPHGVRAADVSLATGSADFVDTLPAAAAIDDPEFGVPFAVETSAPQPPGARELGRRADSAPAPSVAAPVPTNPVDVVPTFERFLVRNSARANSFKVVVDKHGVLLKDPENPRRDLILDLQSAQAAFPSLFIGDRFVATRRARRAQ